MKTQNDHWRYFIILGAVLGLVGVAELLSKNFRCSLTWEILGLASIVVGMTKYWWLVRRQRL